MLPLPCGAAHVVCRGGTSTRGRPQRQRAGVTFPAPKGPGTAWRAGASLRMDRGAGPALLPRCGISVHGPRCRAACSPPGGRADQEKESEAAPRRTASLVAETAHWSVLVRPQQVTLGSLVLVCREPATAFGAVSPQALTDLHGVVARAERML